MTKPSLSSNQFTIGTKDFIPAGHIDWFWSQIPTLGVFEEGNMDTISPYIHIDISLTLGVIENISVQASCSPTEITYFKHLFQEFWDIFAWSYNKMLGIDPTTIEHHIYTWPDAPPIH